MKRFFSRIMRKSQAFFSALEDILTSKDIASLILPRQISPIIMIPGSSATENRFSHLIKKLQQETKKRKNFIRIKIWNNGEITYKGEVDSLDQQPFIVIGFQNNRDGYRNIKKQAKMLEEVFRTLQKCQPFKEFKAIGHSNGGLILTLFLEHFLPDYKNVRCQTLLTIGTPYNFRQKNEEKQTEMLVDLINSRQSLPKDLTVLSVLGRRTPYSDGIVHHHSVRAGRLIFEDAVQSYQEIELTGELTHHSHLLRHQQLIDLIEAKILNKKSK